MAKYIDADRLRAELEKRLKNVRDYMNGAGMRYKGPKYYKAQGKESAYDALLNVIDSLQQERQMPDSTQIIAEWEKEKAVLEQMDFRGDAERMAYNAFLGGFVKGLVYEGTK